MHKANWNYPTAIKFGPGRIKELADHARALGMRRPLLVTDRALAALPITQLACDILRGSGFAPVIFSDVQPNPTDVDLDAGVAAYHAGGHDGVIAFGGGSGLDLGKLIAFMAGQNRPVWDFEDVDDWYTRADASKIAPILAVPTTAGTGSEVGRAAVVTNSERHEKKVIFHPKMLPQIVIADPELTVGMPKAITAGTGMDAFAHCLEAYCSTFYHPMAAGVAVEGMRLVLENLELAIAEPDNIDARGNMMAAAAMGATAFQKGLGAVHALSHPIGALFNTHHGTTNAVVMVAVLHANRPVIEEKINRLAAYVGISGGFDGFVAEVARLNKAVSIPANLHQLGVPFDQFDNIVDAAMKDVTAGGNPLPMTHELTSKMLADAFSGD